MGILPPLNHRDVASAPPIPVVYHGGRVMRGVRIHTIFWAPSGFHFNGSPTPGVLGYQPMVQRFIADAAHDSGSKSNIFSILSEYPDPGSGLYKFAYDPATDSINDTDPYPAKSKQCPSPAGIPTCVTDRQLAKEIDKVIQSRDPGARGLHNIWFILLPPDVDTCDAIGECGTTAYAGYHSLFNLGHGATVYSPIPDPQIEFVAPPGADPQGNVEAEETIDTVSHEAVEAVTDPIGQGWMDPNGFEVGDKCEFPEYGTPLGYAPDGSPYNQLINGRRYLIQEMWSNVRQGCVQKNSSSHSALPLARVDLRQFSSSVSGNIGAQRAGVTVQVGLVRSAGVDLVAEGAGRTRADGSWGPIKLNGPDGIHSPSDDRDILVVEYGNHGPKPDLIATGLGGNPFILSGWTGWFDLDNGYRLTSSSVQVSPCEQVGVLGVGGRSTPPPNDWCDGETNVARVTAPGITPRTQVSIGSTDNRAVTSANRNGALVKLVVGAGEPGSVSALGNRQIFITPSGFPSCTADLRAQSIRCSGLRPHASYVIGSRRSRANSHGAASFGGFARRVRGGQVFALRNSSGRVLTRLHVAHLRVDIKGLQTVISGGRCQAGDYYGLPVRHPPISGAIGLGIGGTGRICPYSGRAAGLSAEQISQVDDLSGGLTRTEVPDLRHASPADGAPVYGPFIALARSGLPAPHNGVIATGAQISLTITPSRSHRRVFHAGNVDTARGVTVRGLRRGAYVAHWVVRDANGDTRTVVTQFVQER